MLHKPIIDCYYDRRMALVTDPAGNVSRSPSKPRRFVEQLQLSPLWDYIYRDSEPWNQFILQDFYPLHYEDFELAHTEEYVAAFFAGREPLASSSGLRWSQEFADTVRWTNGSLWGAVQGAILDPSHIALSPTSGFHHARPERGGGFCTFSGQVISAVKAWREYQKRGAWIDLDGHHGNSIDDSHGFMPDIDKALPSPWWCNINPKGAGDAYLNDLGKGLVGLGDLILKGEVDYVCVAHGADSHIDDDLGAGQLTTREWLDAACLVYGTINEWGKIFGRPIPTVLSLFGGYRADSPVSVLELHTADLAIALRELAGVKINYAPRVATRKGRK